jgi:hypothetical protein
MRHQHFEQLWALKARLKQFEVALLGSLVAGHRLSSQIPQSCNFWLATFHFAPERFAPRLLFPKRIPKAHSHLPRGIPVVGVSERGTEG